MQLQKIGVHPGKKKVFLQKVIYVEGIYIEWYVVDNALNYYYPSKYMH